MEIWIGDDMIGGWLPIDPLAVGYFGTCSFGSPVILEKSFKRKRWMQDGRKTGSSHDKR